MLSYQMRASVSVRRRVDAPEGVDDPEAVATKLMELTLRRCDVTWGPTVSHQRHTYGTTTSVETRSPFLRVDVDVFGAADWVVATVWAGDSRLCDRLAIEVLETEMSMREHPCLECVVGRSHPEFRYMVDALGAVLHDARCHFLATHFDGLLIDDDGHDLTVD